MIYLVLSRPVALASMLMAVGLRCVSFNDVTKIVFQTWNRGGIESTSVVLRK